MSRIGVRVIEALAPDPAGRLDRFVWDDAIPGFGVVCKPSGHKSYIFKYRTEAGATRRLTLGRVSALTVVEARRIAQDHYFTAKRGGDPAADRKSARTALTVSQLCEWYLAAAADGVILGRRGRPIKSSTLALDRSRISCHIIPLIGERTVESLTPADVQGMQAKIAAGYRAGPRPPGHRGGVTSGGAGVAGRSLATFRSLLAHAQRAGVITSHPAAGVRRLADNKCHRRLQIEEIHRLGSALRLAAGEGALPVTVRLIRFLLLTGFRRSEAVTLPLSAINAATQTIFLADTKSGAQTRVVARCVLDCLPMVPTGTWAFPGTRSDRPYGGLPSALARIGARAGLPVLRPHMLRHSFASVAADLGMSELLIGGLLGHAGCGATSQYVHHADAALVAAAEVVANEISKILGPAPEFN